MGKRFSKDELILPPLDSSIQPVIQRYKLNGFHLMKMYKAFLKYDADYSGWVSQEEFHSIIKDPAKLYFFSTQLFQMLDIKPRVKTKKYELDFNEFIRVIASFCMFGRDEILRLLFACYDPDKTGLIEVDDLEHLVKQLHGEYFSLSNIKIAFGDLRETKKQDLRLDFEEFDVVDRSWPLLLYPAFRFQNNMMAATLGVKEWTRMAFRVMDLKEEEIQIKLRKLELLRRKQDALTFLARNRAIKKNMGCLRYYMCPCIRHKYAPVPKPPTPVAKERKKINPEEEDSNDRHKHDWIMQDQVQKYLAEKKEKQIAKKEEQAKQNTMHAKVMDEMADRQAVPKSRDRSERTRASDRKNNVAERRAQREAARKNDGLRDQVISYNDGW